jgi:hypothetical protein
MKSLTQNRFLTNVLRALCCAVVLVASSIWATVVTWQLTSDGTAGLGANKAFSESRFATGASRIENTIPIDASHQFLFGAASENGAASKITAGVVGGLNYSLQVGDADSQQEWRSPLSSGGPEIPVRNRERDESALFAASNPATRLTTELDDAIARSTFSEDFVSVPTIQFASMAKGSMDVSVISTANVGVVPVPEISTFFPIVGLIVAVSCTQILRRRRAAQQSTSRRLV